MGVIIREGELKDTSGIFSLINELAKFENEPDAVELTIEDIKNDGFGDHPKFEVFVAELNEELIGMALFYYRYSTWKGKTLHLEDLIVKETARGNGVGKLLYNEVLKYAHQQKLKRVEWAVLNWNTPAVNFYENSGAVVFDDWRVVQMSQEQLKNYIDSI
ncbi:GNAT family N-acetyltransferase [Wenyingzhuangia marina]|uniref:Ribosomal protein S18 acetylase RimI n=1 Tax=Wenyingzhuangia marina TaxID=1195760 RepID=A0A1M5WWF7_9FLAO|nr:GNAT family N-acetyltransferase [Wenyingzhuangia marina]GGF82162.1 N-acetyltransferase [Wenyingzhuangia marina]SHH91927.1 Ribosomal protein S18 acetylase RimI [Wenyingzhuangia marina]